MYGHSTDDPGLLRRSLWVDGVKQQPLAGVSMRYTFNNAKAPTKKETQYYEMLSTRGIWHKGLKASTEQVVDEDKLALLDKRRVPAEA